MKSHLYSLNLMPEMLDAIKRRVRPFIDEAQNGSLSLEFLLGEIYLQGLADGVRVCGDDDEEE